VKESQKGKGKEQQKKKQASLYYMVKKKTETWIFTFF